jgi:hypothetical protein
MSSRKCGGPCCAAARGGMHAGETVGKKSENGQERRARNLTTSSWHGNDILRALTPGSRLRGAPPSISSAATLSTSHGTRHVRMAAPHPARSFVRSHALARPLRPADPAPPRPEGSHLLYVYRALSLR